MLCLQPVSILIQPLFRPHMGPEGPTGELGRCCPRPWPQEVTVPTPVHQVALVSLCGPGGSSALCIHLLPGLPGLSQAQGQEAQSGRKIKAPLETFLDLKTCVFMHPFIPQIFIEHFIRDSSEQTPA